MHNIYEMSKKIEEEDKKFELQAKNIANAYRKVEQLKVTPVVQRQQPKKQKAPSAYAIKVKETLKQINANKAKQMQSIPKHINEHPTVPNNPFSRLQKAGANKLFNTIQSYNARICEFAYHKLKDNYRQEEEKQQAFIAKFKLFKLFRAWKKYYSKECSRREKEEKQLASIDLKSMELAKEFRSFLLLKKSFKIWQIETKRQIKRKRFQLQAIKEEIKSEKTQQKSIKRAIIKQQNSQLQNKVKGFLDGLKEKVVQKDRLKTIKQKTEESKPNQITQNEIPPLNQIEENNNSPQSNHQQQSQAAEEVVIQPPLPHQEKKPMTNEDLQKMRKQLEFKHKNRKETLQKLRKEKQQKKKEEQKQRIQIEKQIQIQQKRIKQEKYKEYLKNKLQQQQWQKRQKEMTLLADSFNIKRIKKYYGWLPWTSLSQRTKEKGTALYQTLLLIVYRVKGTVFLSNIAEISKKNLNNQMKLMDKRYSAALLKKAFIGFKRNRLQENQQKQVYEIMHSVNILKISFAAWKQVRSVIASQNYEWEKPRVKRAETFYHLQLKNKGLKSLILNKQQQKREKCIMQQKDKIKNKIKSMLEDSESFDYQSYL